MKGKAQVCSFSKTCTGQQCDQLIDFTDEIVKYVVVAGIADEEIKKDVLGHVDLDKRSLNDTISLIENKEMAARALSSAFVSNDSSTAIHQQRANLKNQKEGDQRLRMKTNCLTCNKTIAKYKMRRGNPKEFTHCITCWQKIHQSSPSSSDKRTNSNNTGAIFDYVGAINQPSIPKKKPYKGPTLQHHIFDGSYGWMIKESRKQPSIMYDMYIFYMTCFTK